MQFGRPLDLTGLATALRIEDAGAWHLYDPDKHLPPAKDTLLRVYGTIMSHVTIADMPEDARLLRLLVDAAAVLHGERNRATGWRVLGVDPNLGRGIIAGRRGCVLEWPVWVMAVNFGLGHMRHDKREDYFYDDYK
ncbi:hypothetical protein D2T29_12335 [Sinirhodobacter populi]|uniref:Uncharacterized protein n=1 Tax=Paenirhodobacter populi TaxID=2306993 RepID=A0A443KCW6_9RHOB|nr:hypothetical protein [Sinirhodobacter populi]RWR30453.1 hypothetical protein D2T29_12335 [Sinirhodobacter populi]